MLRTGAASDSCLRETTLVPTASIVNGSSREKCCTVIYDWNIVPGFYDDETAMMRKEDVDRVVHQYVAPM